MTTAALPGPLVPAPPLPPPARTMVPAPAPAGATAPRPAINPWVVAVTVTLATFMELLDTSIANVSLPHIAGGLGTDQDEATWVLTSYLVANAIVLPMSAWLSRVFGRKNYYMACVALFTVSSFLCGIAPNLSALIFFRVLQGIGGGGLAPCEQAILVDTFPPAKRAGAFALYSMAIVLAPAIGPTLGGWITDNYSWRWVFFINLPVGVLSLFLTSQLVSDPPEFTAQIKAARASGRLRIDYVGIALIAIAFGCLEVVLDKGQEDDWFGSRFITIFSVTAAVALVLGLVWELRHKDPVVDLTLLKERNFALASCFYFLFGFVLFGSTVMVPQFLQTLEGYTATDAGLALTPGALVIVVLAPLVVRLVKRISPARLIMVGFFILACSLWHYSHLTLAADYRTFALARMFQGLGLAFLFVPASQVAYSYLPKEKNNKASSLTNLFRNEGGSFGIAFVTTWLARRNQFHQSHLAEHVTAFNPLYADRLRAVTTQLTQSGVGSVQAADRAQAQLYASLQHQASLLSYLDCFQLLGNLALVGVLLAFAIKKFRPAGAGGGGH